MLRGMRLAGQSLVGKIIATILFGFLILSFAVWGIGDIFRTTPPSVVAQVGKTSISVDQMRIAYTNELQRLGRQFRTVITPEQARTFGIDQRVLANLVTEAVMSEQAKALLLLLDAAGSQTDAQRLTFLFRQVLQRDPTADEIAASEAFLQAEADPESSLSRWEQFAQVLLCSNELMYVD